MPAPYKVTLALIARSPPDLSVSSEPVRTSIGCATVSGAPASVCTMRLCPLRFTAWSTVKLAPVARWARPLRPASAASAVGLDPAAPAVSTASACACDSVVAAVRAVSTVP